MQNRYSLFSADIPPIAAMEVGSSRTVVIVGEANEEGRMTIVGNGVATSTGVHKGQIVDIKHATIGAQSAIQDADNIASPTIYNVFLAVSGGYIKTMENVGMIPMHSSSRQINDDDIEEVRANAELTEIPENHKVMHSIEQYYRIDNDPMKYLNPRGLQATSLSVNNLIVYAQSEPIENLSTVIRNCSVDVQGYAFGGLCAALAVLSPEQKKSGAVVIDLGGGTTDYAAYTDGILSATASLAVGGDHVTTDICHAFNLTHNVAENIKIKYGSALIGGENNRITVPVDLGFSERSISAKALRTVINARVDEIFKIIRKDLVNKGILQHLNAGVVLTGGAASLPGITELAHTIFGRPCILGVPRKIDGISEWASPHSYATVAGLLLHGYSIKKEKYASKSWHMRFFGHV